MSPPAEQALPVTWPRRAFGAQDLLVAACIVVGVLVGGAPLDAAAGIWLGLAAALIVAGGCALGGLPGGRAVASAVTGVFLVACGAGLGFALAHIDEGASHRIRVSLIALLLAGQLLGLLVLLFAWDVTAAALERDAGPARLGWREGALAAVVVVTLSALVATLAAAPAGGRWSLPPVPEGPRDPLVDYAALLPDDPTSLFVARLSRLRGNPYHASLDERLHNIPGLKVATSDLEDVVIAEQHDPYNNLTIVLRTVRELRLEDVVYSRFPQTRTVRGGLEVSDLRGGFFPGARVVRVDGRTFQIHRGKQTLEQLERRLLERRRLRVRPDVDRLLQRIEGADVYCLFAPTGRELTRYRRGFVAVGKSLVFGEPIRLVELRLFTTASAAADAEATDRRLGDATGVLHQSGDPLLETQRSSRSYEEFKARGFVGGSLPTTGF